MIFDIDRLTNVAGQDFDSPKCRVRSPHITARDSIEIGGYIVAQQERIAELESRNQEQGQLMSAMTEYYEDDKGAAFQSHNIEQQIKGLQFALANIHNPDLLYNTLVKLKEQGK